MSLWSPPGPPGKRVAPLAEEYREAPLWWDDTVVPTLAESPVPDAADVVVVGAGFTGLAAAARLGSHGIHAVVVDSGALGEGASGRNAGMIHGGVRRELAFLERKHGGDLINGKRVGIRAIAEGPEKNHHFAREVGGGIIPTPPPHHLPLRWRAA